MLLPAEVIKKKRNQQSLSQQEIEGFITGFLKNEIPDYQMSALLMAIYFNGLDINERNYLTKSMLYSGEVLEPTSNVFHVDKHSTGGVGDKTSLILGPVVAACGLKVPMISGRGLGHTGGTLDKLESIPGFSTRLDLSAFRKLVKEINVCFIGQTETICPADRRIYALRDVTGTVESLGLICASIMSKKLAEGIHGLVLDVKFGSGAFMKTRAQARELALALMSIARGFDKKISALLTSMEQPLGRFAGNALEVQECLSILRNERDPLFEDTRELSLELSAQMLFLSGQYQTFKAARQAADQALSQGQALLKFEEMCTLQGGRLGELPKARHQKTISADSDGFFRYTDVEKIGVAGILVRAGRAKASDVIEPTSGFEFHVKTGDSVKKGDPLFTIFGAEPALFDGAAATLKLSFELSQTQVPPIQLIRETLTEKDL